MNLTDGIDGYSYRAMSREIDMETLRFVMTGEGREDRPGYYIPSNAPRYAYINGEKLEFIHGELWETEITPRPSND